jgi:ABC-type glycerol-3-phosphate transport system substrate-binding protein
VTSTPDTRFISSDAVGLKVIFWHPWVGQRGKIIDQMALEYNLSNPYDIQVEPRHWGGEEALVEGLAASIQDPPSLVVLPPEYRAGFTELGLPFQDLTPLVQHSSPEIGMNGLSDYHETLLQPIMEGVQIFGLPAAGNTRVMAYNKTWAKLLGFNESPTTWQEFRDQSCAAAKANNRLVDRKLRGTGGWLIDLSPDTSLAWFHSFGKPILYGGADAAADTFTVYQTVFENIKSLSLEGCAWNGRSPYPDMYFADRLALFVTIPISEASAFRKTLTATKSTDEWEILSFPGESVTDTWLADMDYYYLTATEYPNQLAAWFFLKWLSTPEQELRLALSDGMLPARKITWDVVIKADQLPPQQIDWMTTHSLPMVSSYQSGWLNGKAILADGYRQIMQTNTTVEDIAGILKNMDAFAQEMENQ